MDYAQIVNLLQQYLPAKYAHTGLEVVGGLALIKEFVPRLTAWGGPAAGKAADSTAKFLLNSPFRGIILWQAPALISFLDSLTAALVLILNTFREELEKDLTAAIPTPTPAPSDAPKS